MNVSIRRLRAAILLAVVTATGWAVIITAITALIRLANQMPITATGLAEGAAVALYFGFAAGLVWAMMVAIMPRKEGRGISAPVAGMSGALGGMLVLVGMIVGTGGVSAMLTSTMLMPIAIAGVAGSIVGLGIQRGATRGRLLSSQGDPEALEP